MGPGSTYFPAQHMDPIRKHQLQLQAKYNVGDRVYWRGANYRITGRYFRKWMNSIVYDLEEVGQHGTPRAQSKVYEKECVPIIS